jgi:HPt (histidine-containing phosphotransfer) domain-containing protein
VRAGKTLANRREKYYNENITAKDGDDMDKAVMAEILINAEVQGMDFPRGLQRFNGNAQIYARILRAFVKSMPASLDKLRGVTAENLPDYVILIHGLKGSCYGINADEAGKLAENLEIAGKKGDLDFVLGNNDGFIHTVEKLLPCLEELLQSLDSGEQAKAKHKAPDRELLRALLAASQEYDIEAIGQALEKLTQYDYETETDLVPWLKEQAENFAYDAIQEKLEVLLGHI